jgi:chemotaxis protein MotB
MSSGGPAMPGKKPKVEKAPNHERWVISYADLLTLLLATFVVLYASSTQNKHKLDAVAGSFLKAFHGTTPSVSETHGASKGIMDHEPSPVPRPVEAPATANSKMPAKLSQKLAAEVLSLQKVQAQLHALLQPMLDKNQVSMNSQPLTLTIQLDASVLFPSGTAQLSAPGQALLNQVGASLTKLPAPFSIIVQGFTDNQPIATAQFSSNWALSAARAVRVVELFGGDGVAGAQLGAEGFGEFMPVAGNDTDTGRAQNRRVVVVIHAPDPTLDEK